MIDNYEILERQIKSVIESDNTAIANILPSVWTEENVVMEEPYPGLYKYSLTPYCREIIDCFAVDHPMLWLAVMKGAQIGISAGVLIPMLLWSIKNDPCRMYFMVGSPDLVEKATTKLDKGIDRAGLRSLIRTEVQRRRASKSGDTNYMKEFAGGFIQIGNPNNHADLRDVSLRKGLFDDFESVKRQSKQSGSTRKLLEQRFAAYEGRHKIAYVSTPELKDNSNIEEAYLLGDQRKYLTPCPCCGEFIEWKWEVSENGRTGGIVWEPDENGKPKPGTVKYKCQKCGDTFDDKNKYELLNAGYWQPTATPSKPGFYSYHISALYAPLGFFSWERYVHDYLEACPPGQPRNEDLWKTFVNVALGETYAPEAEAVSAKGIMKNTQGYAIGTIPDKLSVAHGNGRIVLLTCAADCNGTVKGINGALEDDARLDYEIVAHTESGATYSIAHGSIGTFVPRERNKAEKAERVKWSYRRNAVNSVWPAFDAIIRKAYQGESGLYYQVNMPGVDVGAYSNLVEDFMDWSIGKYPANPVVGMRGNKEDTYMRDKQNVALFQRGKVRNDVYYLQVGLLKDMNARYMQLQHDPLSDEDQPANFMNFPTPADGLYGYTNYFEHFESEKRKMVKNADGTTSFRWDKVVATAQNHLLDCRIYNLAIKEIIVAAVAEHARKEGQKEFTWVDYCNYVLNR